MKSHCRRCFTSLDGYSVRASWYGSDAEAEDYVVEVTCPWCREVFTLDRSEWYDTVDHDAEEGSENVLEDSSDGEDFE